MKKLFGLIPIVKLSEEDAMEDREATTDEADEDGRLRQGGPRLFAENNL